ncbi:MAG: lysylphosphatidylglycerol synthase transmembrane domain-containing protein [Desulfuromonadaceae bacterium]
MNNSKTNSNTAWHLAGKLLLSGALFIGLTSAGMYTVYTQFARHSVSFDSRLLQPSVLIGLGGLLVIYFGADGLRLYFCIRTMGYRIPFRPMAKLTFLNIFFSNITPMATGGGFAQIWYLHSHGIPVGIASAATTMRTVLAMVFIFSLTPIFVFTLKPLQDIGIIAKTGPALALLTLGYLLFFALILWRSAWLTAMLSRIFSIFHRAGIIGQTRHQRWQYKARREVLRFSHSFSTFFNASPYLILASVFFTAVFLLSLFSFPALLMHGLGYKINYMLSVGLLVVTTFIMYFSPTPGASGIAEGVFGTFFRTLLTSNHLLLVILAWRFVTIYLGMLTGLGILLIEAIRNPTR